MKNQISRLITLIIIFLLTMTVIGCGNGYYKVTNKEADDEISQAVYDQLGTKMCYKDRWFDKSEEIQYYHYIVNDYKDEDLLLDMVEIINGKIKEDKITSRICLVIYEVEAGGAQTRVRLYNYYIDDSGYRSYENLQNLEIWGSANITSPYNKASSYINLKDIKALTVAKRISLNAEDEGIDWYEIWPDLEYYEVVDRFEN